MLAYLVCEIENVDFFVKHVDSSNFVISDVEIYKKVVMGRLIEIIQ